MIVVDASALIELLLATPRGLALLDRLSAISLSLHVPHCADVEVVSALGRMVRLRQIQPADATQALRDLQDLGLIRHSHEPYLQRMLALRTNISAHDASYVALAEILGCPLVTGDARLARAAGIRCRVETLSPAD